MPNQELKNVIHSTFQELNKESKAIIDSSLSPETATERICRTVSSKISADTKGYINEIYTALASEIKEKEYFKDPEHLNAFYRLDLRNRIEEKYQFEIESLDSYKKGIDFKEVNKIYASVGTMAGTFAVGGILKYALLSAVNIPIIVIIAGAVLVGVATYFAVSVKNKSAYNRAVEKYLDDLENDILDWLTSIEKFFNEQIHSLCKT